MKKNYDEMTLGELKGEKAHWAAFRKELKETGREPTAEELEEEYGFAQWEMAHPLVFIKKQVEEDTGLEVVVNSCGDSCGIELRNRPE